jgi:DNA-binding SARP family transcriptional activator
VVDPEVEVAVLGPIEIRGAAETFCRSAARELVVYLAFHRNGSGNDEWAEALWPHQSLSRATRHSTASDARRSLGQATNGTEHLPRAGRRLRLGDSVGTDVERFARLASDPDPTSWKGALGLIRGSLFAGLKRSDWAVFDGTQAQVETMVADAALKGAEYFMNRSGREAEWMIRQALRVNPYDERLHRALLRAADAQGNRVGLRSVMNQLRALADEPWEPVSRVLPGLDVGDGGTSIHPQTMALFHELTQGRTPAAERSPVRL